MPAVHSTLYTVNYCLLRFEGIAEVVPNLDVAGKHRRILAQFLLEVEKVTKLYNKQCDNPPPLIGLPPVTGGGHTAGKGVRTVSWGGLFITLAWGCCSR